MGMTKQGQYPATGISQEDKPVGKTGQVDGSSDGPANVAWRRGSAIIVEGSGGHNSGVPPLSSRQQLVSCELAKEK